MNKTQSQTFPPGRIKIVRALKTLLLTKNFNYITTAEIAKTAGVTEGLIYKYFKDKRDLMYQVLKEYFERFISQMEKDLKGIDGALNKLRMIIWSTLNLYALHRVFARIILIEARNSPDYFKSEAYGLIKKYSTSIILKIIEDGVHNGEIREDIDPGSIRYTILGAMEHACLAQVIFNREIDPDQITENICRIIFTGIKK